MAFPIGAVLAQTSDFAPTGPSPQQMRMVSDGAAAANLLPHLEAETAKMMAQTQIRVLGQLRAGKLTPEAAIEAWREIAAAQQLLKNFKVRATMGQSVAQELGRELDPQKDAA